MGTFTQRNPACARPRFRQMNKPPGLYLSRRPFSSHPWKVNLCLSYYPPGLLATTTTGLGRDFDLGLRVCRSGVRYAGTAADLHSLAYSHAISNPSSIANAYPVPNLDALPHCNGNPHRNPNADSDKHAGADGQLAHLRLHPHLHRRQNPGKPTSTIRTGTIPEPASVVGPTLPLTSLPNGLSNSLLAKMLGSHPVTRVRGSKSIETICRITVNPPTRHWMS